MHHIKLFKSFLGVVLLTIAIDARASTVLYDFENQPIDTQTPFSIASAGVTALFTGPPAVDPGAFGISSNFPSPTGFQYRLLTGDFLTIGSAFAASGSALTIRFSVPIAGVAFTFALDDPSNASTLSLRTDSGGAATAQGSLTSGFRYPEGTFAFVGAPFATLTLLSTAIDFQIDDLLVTPAAAVPEPGLMSLFGAGLGSLVFVRRRRQLSKVV